jgi:hypothetical protein
MATIIHRAFLHRPAENHYLERIRELIESGEIANTSHSGTGKVIVGVFQALHEAMRAVDPSIPTDLPPHCLDPVAVAKFFGIPFEDSNRQGKTKPVPPPRPTIASPYLDAKQAADYLGMTVKALYGHVERRKLRPLPGYKKYRFTREQLDAFLRGEKP